VQRCFIIGYMCGMAVTVLQAAGGVVSVVKTDPHTGRLVRTIVRQHSPTPSQPLRTPPAPLAETVDRIAQQNRLSPQLVHSIIQVESNYDPEAISSKGALGLMQLIPATAKRFGVANVFDPADNVEGGARYLKYLLQLYNGDQALALAAYNAGEGAVARYGGVPPFPETQDYVARVQQRLQGMRAAQVTAGPAPTVQSSEAPASPNPQEVHNPIHEVVDANGRIFYTSQ